jgi:hypothetical protein
MKSRIFAFALSIPMLFACGRKDGYRLVWSDEFEVNGLVDSAKWSYDTTGNSWGWGNNELQYYTAYEGKNAEVVNGFLHIRAIRENAGGKDYSSARLITRHKGDWLYGRVEVRAKLPGSRGIWPAIWMLPTDNFYGIWPASGEIDIMEHVGYMPDSVFASTHCQSYYFKLGTQKTRGLYLPPAPAVFTPTRWSGMQSRSAFPATILSIFALKTSIRPLPNGLSTSPSTSFSMLPWVATGAA